MISHAGSLWNEFELKYVIRACLISKPIGKNTPFSSKLLVSLQCPHHQDSRRKPEVKKGWMSHVQAPFKPKAEWAKRGFSWRTTNSLLKSTLIAYENKCNFYIAKHLGGSIQNNAFSAWKCKAFFGLQEDVKRFSILSSKENKIVLGRVTSLEIV